MDEDWDDWTTQELCDLQVCYGDSQVEFARRAGVDRRTVQRWTSGQTTPTDRRVIARLNTLARQRIAHKAPWLLDPEGTLLMNRRDALRLLASGAAMTVPALLPTLPRTLDDTQLDHIEATTTVLASAYYDVAPHTLLAPVNAHLEEASRLLKVSMRPAQRQRLLSLTGDMAAFVARLAFLCDRPGQMEAFLRLAASRAGEAEDRVLLAEIWCAQGHLYSDSVNGSPYHDPKTAMTLLEHATLLAVDAPGWVRSHIAVRVAEERAAAKDAHGTDAALDTAVRALHDTSGPPMPADGFLSTAGYFAHWGTGLEGYQGTCEVLLGRPERAVRTLETRLDGPLTPRVRAINLTDLGAARASQGQPEEAAACLTQAHDLNGTSGNTIGYQRILGARQRIDPRCNDLPAVRALDERLRAR
ncbi:MAG: helix-turn-helix domain-containing protein [Egibacteraceae bacterium]